MNKNIVLILEFKDAKLIRTNNHTIDRISVFGEKSFKRGEAKFSNFKEPITKFQISNLLHVILGERPVNTQRASSYKNQNWIMALAEDSLIKYNSPKVRVNKKGELSYIKEKTTLNKASWDAWNSGIINWEMLRNYCESNFGEILEEFSKIFNNPLKIKFTTIAEEIFQNHLTDPKYNTILEKIDSFKGLSGLSTFLKTKKSGIYMKYGTTKRRGSALTYSRAIGDAEIYYGEIIVFINEEILNMIRDNYKGTATILDGGVVNIKTIQYGIDNDYLYDFIKVKDISIEKYEN